MEYIAMMNGPAGVYEAENRDVTAGDAEWLAMLAESGRSDSGVSVSAYNAMTSAAVWQAVNLISGDISKLPLYVYERDANERTGTQSRTHPAFNLVLHRSNRYMSAFQFWRRMMTHVLIWNQAYAWIQYDAANRPISLWPLLPDRTYPGVVVGNSVNVLTGYNSSALLLPGARMVYASEINGVLRIIDPAEMLHITSVNLDSIQPTHLIDNARDSWGLTLAAEGFSSKFFANGANAGGILEIPLGTTKRAADNLVEGLYRQHTGVENAFKTVILREGAKYHNTQVKPVDAQLDALRQEQIREVARWYNLPPHKLGDQSRVSYNSLEQENKSYLDSTLSPWLKTITSECWMKLLTVRQQQSGRYYFRHDIRELVQADAQSQSAVISTYLASGVINANEARGWLNMDERPDGEGDQYYYSNNMQPVGQQEETPPPEPPPVEPDPDEQTGEEGRCMICERILTGRQAKFCTVACRQKAYRIRNKRAKI